MPAGVVPDGPRQIRGTPEAARSDRKLELVDVLIDAEKITG
jgi:hypothetical protein